MYTESIILSPLFIFFKVHKILTGQLRKCLSVMNRYCCRHFLAKRMMCFFSRLSGCYESLSGGNTGDAVVDFSGSVNEPLNLEAGNYCTDPKVKDKLFSDLLEVYNRGGIISCSIAVSNNQWN